MSSESRAIAAFTALGVVMVGVALGVTRFLPDRAGVASLPSVETASPQALASPAPMSTQSTRTKGVPLRLLQRPTLSATEVAFDFAGEIWVVPRAGGEARRLVTGQLRNSRPIFSPDGSQIAFTGIYDGNADVYVVPAAGGEARRLTHHPSSDEAVGWTPDGARVLFRSQRLTPRDLPQLFTVSTAGGFPEMLPLPSGNDASFSPDGKRLAYTPFNQWQPEWKKYRGGQMTFIGLADLSDSHVDKVPRKESNDRYPMWVGDTVYFVSDRSGAYGLFAYDVKGGGVREVVRDPGGVDIHYASAGPGGIVYERLDGLYVYDLASSASKKVNISISADLPQVRPRFERVSHEDILHVAISPTGKRVLVEAHGEILSVPAEKGDARNLTQSPTVADRDPAWSPDGKWVAWLSDATGEYALYFRSPDGLGDTKKVDLGDPPSFFYSPCWSPDSKKLVVADKRLNLWLIDVEHPVPVKVDKGRFDGDSFDASWSPDSRWLAYQKHLENQLEATFIYSLSDKKIHQVTDGASDATSARFDKGGKYLWFIARTDVGVAGSEGMVSLGHPSTSNVYAVVLQKDRTSPVAPQSDEEPDAGVFAKAASGGGKGGHAKEDGDKKDDGDKGDKADGKKAPPVDIDFEGIDQRIVALPIDRANYVELEAGAEGVVFLVTAPVGLSDEDYVEINDEPPPLDLWRFDLKKRKAERFVEKLDGGDRARFLVTEDRKKILYAKDHKLFIAGADEPPKGPDGAKALKLDELEVWVDPRAEWRQIYREVWRIERDFLYDSHFHGLDLAATEKLYEPWVDGIASREDLSALLSQALSNLVLGHVWMRGGMLPRQARVNVGLLGADFSVEEGRYRFARILRGENWNPGLRAPLTQPGVDVKEGEYLLAVDDKDVKGSDEVYRFFLGRAGKQTVLTVGPKPDGVGSRKVVVVPTGSEGSLRLRTWMEGNRKKVDELTNGKIGYVFIPDTLFQGYANFNRYYFSQIGKQGVILDERFNHGGAIADYIVNVLGWTPTMMNTQRDGEDTFDPKAIFGPKVMIANQMSGSGGDGLPWLFKHAHLGPLVGTRTWGGWVGIGGYPRLIDGGRVTAPRDAGYDMNGKWVIENEGVAPDVEVEQDPALVRKGHDPQLERAVALALEGLAKNPPPKPTRPPYPDYGPRLPIFPAR